MTSLSSYIARSHRRHGQDITVLSCPVCVGGVNRICDKTRQFYLVSTQLAFNLQLLSLKYIEDYRKLGNWKLGLDKTHVLSSLQLLCSHCRHGQDKTVSSCPCRRCERAIMHTYDTRPLQMALFHRYEMYLSHLQLALRWRLGHYRVL